MNQRTQSDVFLNSTSQENMMSSTQAERTEERDRTMVMRLRHR